MKEKDLIKYLKDTYEINYIYPTIPTDNPSTTTPTGCTIYDNIMDVYTNETTYFIQFITVGRDQDETQNRSIEIIDAFKAIILAEEFIGDNVDGEILIDITLRNATTSRIEMDLEFRYHYGFNIELILK